MSPRRNSDKMKSNKGSGLIAVGGGTLFVQIAQSIANPTLRQIAIYLAPTVAVIVAALTAWIVKVVEDYLDHRETERVFDRAEREYKRIMNDPHSSQDEKEQAQKDYDTLNKAKRKIVLDAVHRLTPK